MAANSLRERILVQLVSTVSDVEAISTVRRTKQSYAKLKEFAVTQFPVVAIVGRLPQPLEHIKGRAREVPIYLFQIYKLISLFTAWPMRMKILWSVIWLMIYGLCYMQTKQSIIWLLALP